jgi:hypothetical protein
MTIRTWDEAESDLARLADAKALDAAMRAYRIAGRGWRTAALKRLQLEALRQLKRSNPQ